MGNLDCSEQSKNIKFEICHEISDGNYIIEKKISKKSNNKIKICHEVNDCNCLSERTKTENYTDKNIICHEIINENFISNNTKRENNKDKNRYLYIIQTPNQTNDSISYLNTLIKNESTELDLFNLDEEKSLMKNNNKDLIINQKFINDSSRAKSSDNKYLKKREISTIQKNESNFNFYDSSMYIINFIIFYF